MGNSPVPAGDAASSQPQFHMFRFGAGAVLAVSTKIKILGRCINESPKGFGSIYEMQTLNFEVGARGSMDPLAPTRVKC